MKYNTRKMDDIVSRRYINDLNKRSEKREIAIALLKIIGMVILSILAIDMLFFMAWVLSGQHPVDNFYIGSITAHIIKAII